MRSALRRALLYLALAAAVLFFIFPVAWLGLASIKSNLDLYAVPPKIWLERPTGSHWLGAFSRDSMALYFFNSMVVAAASTFAALFFGTMAAYALARKTLRRESLLAFTFLVVRMLPPMVVALPLFILMKKLNLLDTRLALIIAHTGFNLPFVVWMMRTFILAVPSQIEEAAMLDGLTRLAAFRKVVLPLLKPSLVAVTIFCVIFSWSEFLFGFLLTQSQAKTVPVTVAELFLPQAAAVGVALIVPVFIFSLLVQKYLIHTFSFGAVTGRPMGRSTAGHLSRQ